MANEVAERFWAALPKADRSGPLGDQEFIQHLYNLCSTGDVVSARLVMHELTCTRQCTGKLARKHAGAINDRLFQVLQHILWELNVEEEEAKQ